MQGDVATLPDIILESLIFPANLECAESLSPDSDAEEEQVYKVDTNCHTCGAGLRICVVASSFAIRSLHTLLLRDLNLLCPHCVRSLCHHGRST